MVAWIQIKTLGRIKVINSYSGLRRRQIFLEHVRSVYELPVQIILSVNILVKVQFNYLKIAVFIVAWILVSLVVVPKDY